VDGISEDISKLQLASRVVDRKNPMRYTLHNVKDMFFEPTEVEM
jgi:hypothetical protein